MAIQYNADGKLKNFEEGIRMVTCPNCDGEYRQVFEEQVPGFRSLSYDTCPYCNFTLKTSMDEEFFNYPI